MFSAPVKQGPPPPPPQARALPGLTTAEQQAFNAGYSQFIANETVQSGLGPVFNGISCAQCHRAGAAGGASADLGVSVVTRFGGMVNGQYSDLANLGGPSLQRRSLREILPNYPIPGEVVPPQAQFVSRRISTPMFGAGLIDSIADETILAFAQQGRDPDGVMGLPHMVVDPETGAIQVGRFGWKAQISRLRVFTADAMLNEGGITSTIFPHENLPQGQPIPPGADQVADPEDLGTRLTRLTNYSRFTAPPDSRVLNVHGQELFSQIRCTACHVPVMRTKPSEVQALSEKVVPLYSDLLLHRMGPGLDDGVRQGQAAGDQWRTAPLWGLGQRPFLLHDGRATTIDQAILAHGGEAQRARDRYVALSGPDKQALIQFLSGL